MDSSLLAYIVAPFITGVFAIIGQAIISNRKAAEQDIKDAVRDQKTSDRLDRIEENQIRQEKKLDEHNGYAKRFEEIEGVVRRHVVRLDDVQQMLLDDALLPAQFHIGWIALRGRGVLMRVVQREEVLAKKSTVSGGFLTSY